ncbi:MAG: cytochrome c [Actinomycetota bacterium]
MTYRSYDEELEASTNKWMLWGAGLMGVLILLFAVYLFFESSNRAEALEAHEHEMETLGSEVYSLNCAACHGAAGEGGIGPALNAQQFLGEVKDAQINALITVGIPGSQMAAYSIDYNGPLTAEDIGAVTAFLRSWEEEAPDNPDWRSCCP